jgi:hypothetical protein
MDRCPECGKDRDLVGRAHLCFLVAGKVFGQQEIQAEIKAATKRGGPRKRADEPVSRMTKWRRRKDAEHGKRNSPR